MTKLLTKSWIVAPVGAAIYLLCTVLFWQKPPAMTVKQSLAEVFNNIGPSWDFNNPEADLLISELKDEKKTLDKRQQDLDDLATRLNTERAELNQVIQSIHTLQADFDKAVLRVKDDEIGNLKKLAKVYAAMDPETAASVLGQMDNGAVVRIMIFLKDNETAAIMEAMAKKSDADSKRAAEISERIRLSSHTTAAK